METSTSDIFAAFVQYLDSDLEKRENIKSSCKEIDQLSREICTVLQAIHSSELAIAPACVKARSLFGNARDGYQKLKDVVPLADYYKYHDQWRMITQRFCFVISLTTWVETGNVAPYETVAEILGLAGIKDENYFRLDGEDYLLSLLTLCTELVRFAVNSATWKKYGRAVQVSKFIADINSGFRMLNLKNDHLRKRYDALKYDIKKIEDIVFDLSVRGMLRVNENGEVEEDGDEIPEPMAEEDVDPQLEVRGDD